MSNPYWGKLPPPNIVRGNSVKKEREMAVAEGRNNSRVPPNKRDRHHDHEQDLDMVPLGGRGDELLDEDGGYGDRSSSQFPSSHRRSQYRASLQTEAPTVSTQSPFASPTDSSFGRSGLAPRPPSFPYDPAGQAHNNDYKDKRRRRQSRNKEQSYEEKGNSERPPAAPDAPRPPPPVSYKQPYSSGNTARSRSTRRSEGPVSSSQGVADEYYARRGSASRAPYRPDNLEWDPQVPERLDTLHRRATEGSQTSEGESQKRREWAPDRSPLQRLEITLDSITKEEKRARVEEAERLAKTGGNGEKQKQNTVRFRNRPVAKAPEIGSRSDSQASPTSGPPQAPNLKQKEEVQRRRMLGNQRQAPPETLTVKAPLEVDYQNPDELDRSPRQVKSSGVQRGQSIQGRSYFPATAAIAAGTAKVGRSKSNRLQKEPPGDPWLHRRIDAEAKYQDVALRRTSGSNQQDPGLLVETPRRRAPEKSLDEDLPIQGVIASRDLDDEPDEDMNSKPARQLSKIERLAGQRLPPEAVKLQPGNTRATKTVRVDGAKYGLPSNNSDSNARNGAQEPTNHHHLSDVLRHRHETSSGQGVYSPARRLDEWKKGGVAQLSGSLLNLEADEQAELDKDKAWWEAGNTGKRRRSMTTKQRRAEAYDGEYDDNSVPTRFKPALFMRAGPSLRYCGLRREPAPSRGVQALTGIRNEREIWRGSIMIVTQDDHSSYKLAPTLRLFLQPIDLLPPPPAQVDGQGGLAPEYVDPLAGLPKIGRDGKTLYVRPVEDLDEERDLSKEETDEGLFELKRSNYDGAAERKYAKPHYDGEKAGKYKEVRGFRLHAEHGVTFWRFNIEIELRDKQQRIAYRINRGPATGFWVPARGQAMNIMFHSCNGFSYGTDPNPFNGPDPLWRDVLNNHQTTPFHVMLGGGDQIYNDAIISETTLFREWTEIKDPHHKENVAFSPELQGELESFYLNRYCMWFSQGLFGLAVTQIPMVNLWDDHDIIDGYGSYPDRYMRSPVMCGLGAIAFKYYMLFQHQSSIDEGEETEPQWILGEAPGPYMGELSRSIFLQLGRSVAFLGMDCRTERMNDEIVSAETYHKIFDRLERDIIKGDTQHLIVLVGVPVAYPRMVWLENILTSKAMDPIKALGRAGLLGKGLLNHLDGGVEILDDMDDHWTAKHHKEERNWFIQELQDLAAEKSVRVTVLGGDVHLGAIGQFYSNPKHKLPKDKDHRYMPNIISSAIVNAPPPDALADVLNKRNKIHHLDTDTDEDMIPIFTHDVTGKPRNNKRLLNRRNWCSIKMYDPELSPPPTPVDEAYSEPQTDRTATSPPARGGLLRRLSQSAGIGTKSRGPSYRADASVPPLSNPSFFGRQPPGPRRGSVDSQRPGILTRTLSLTRGGSLFRRSSKRKPDSGGINGYGADSDEYDSEYDSESPQRRVGLRGGAGSPDEESYFPQMDRLDPSGRDTDYPTHEASTSVASGTPQQGFNRRQFHRTPTGMSEKQRKRPGNQINLENGLDICLNVEVNHQDPAGITMPYRLLVPALWYEGVPEGEVVEKVRGGLTRWLSFSKNKQGHAV